MTKKEFMQKLDKLLIDVDYSEKIEIFNYYEEYFSDININDYDEVPNNMDPTQIAKEILLEYNITGKNNNHRKSKRPFVNLLLLLGAIISAPITLPLAIFIVIMFFLAILGIFSVVFSIVGGIVSVIAFPFTFLYNTIFKNGYYISTYSSIGIIILSIGLFLIIYSLIVNFLRLIMFLLSWIFTKIYLFVTKKEVNFKSQVHTFDSLDKLVITDFPGKIKIIKSNVNELTFKNLSNHNIDIDYNNSTLDISLKSKIYTHLSTMELVIKYNNDDLDMTLMDILGNIEIDTANKSNIHLTNIMGKIYINVKKGEKIKLNTHDILAKVNVDDTIITSNTANIVIFIADIIGSVNIREVV